MYSCIRGFVKGNPMFSPVHIHGCLLQQSRTERQQSRPVTSPLCTVMPCWWSDVLPWFCWRQPRCLCCSTDQMKISWPYFTLLYYLNCDAKSSLEPFINCQQITPVCGTPVLAWISQTMDVQTCSDSWPLTEQWKNSWRTLTLPRPQHFHLTFCCLGHLNWLRGLYTAGTLTV